MKDQTNDPLMTGKEAAKYMKYGSQTLAAWRCNKTYPLKFIRIGRSIRYRRSDVDAFLMNQTKEQ